MAVRVPQHVEIMARANLAEAQRIVAALSSITTVEALEAAERAVMRSPNKNDLRMAIRGVAAAARGESRQPARAEVPPSFAIPAHA